MPRRSAVLITIRWRDIPAQVNAQVGRERHQVVLPARFQRAIDRARRKAGIDTAAADVAQWRRESLPLEGDPQAAAEREAARLEAEYTKERLGRLAFVGGFDQDVDHGDDGAISTAELAALEELDEPGVGYDS
jgi:hypothetical protein